MTMLSLHAHRCWTSLSRFCDRLRANRAILPSIFEFRDMRIYYCNFVKSWWVQNIDFLKPSIFMKSTHTADTDFPSLKNRVFMEFDGNGCEPVCIEFNTEYHGTSLDRTRSEPWFWWKTGSKSKNGLFQRGGTHVSKQYLISWIIRAFRWITVSPWL